MNIIVTAAHTPFLHGGASYLTEGLVRALDTAGHSVELVRLPFQFQPEASLERLMSFCAGLDLGSPNGQRVDRLISLQFPAYGVQHPHHVSWIMHQHRAVYELYDDNDASPALRQLREQVIDFDQRSLAAISAAGRCLTISARVSERLQAFNGISSQALLHPPPLAEHYRCAPAQPYIFYPSRLESLKRQDLLIEAARHLRSPVAILIAGSGGQQQRFQQLVAAHGLEQRVRFLGQLSESEKIAFYAHALGVFFGPFDEDYGYITLEAMLSAKPVITCSDSGGPLAFVRDGETGRVLAPDAHAIAEAIDALHADPAAAAAMGQAGLARYHSLGISWTQVVERLTTV